MPISTWCSDADNDALTFTRTAPEPQHGTATAANGVITYTPAAGYTGPDSFGYVANDGHGGTTTNTYSVNVVTPPAPTCDSPAAISVRPGASRGLRADVHAEQPGDNADQQLPLVRLQLQRPVRRRGSTYVIDSQPAHGTLSGSGQSRTLSAGPDEGDATFTWHAHGPNAGDSATQTQVVTIDADANTAPTCQASSSNAKPGVQRTITPSCGDPEFDSLTYTKQSNPAHGTLTDTDGVLRYTADSGYLGADSFTFRASDGHGGQSGITTISITVTTANTAPSCFAGPYQFDVESGSSLLFSAPPCSDPDGDTLTYEIVDQPTHGTISAPGAGGSRTYTPANGYEGPDSFTFRASDGTDHSATYTVSITVTPSTNGAPVCTTFSRSIAPGTATTIQLACSDPEGDPITLEKVAGPSHGTLGAIDQGTDQAVYTPTAGFNGADSFTYRATDGSATGATATVTLERHARPDVPGRHAQDEGRHRGLDPAHLHGSGRRPADALEGHRPGPRHAGRDRPAATTVTYTPAAGYFGPDSFTYRASDGTANSAPATVSITVTRPRELLGRLAQDEGRHGGLGAADLHRRRRRPADALDRQRPGARHARRDRGRRRDLHAGRGLLRRRLVHLQGERRHRGLRPGDREPRPSPGRRPARTSRGASAPARASRSR